MYVYMYGLRLGQKHLRRYNNDIDSLRKCFLSTSSLPGIGVTPVPRQEYCLPSGNVLSNEENTFDKGMRKEPRYFLESWHWSWGGERQDGTSCVLGSPGRGLRQEMPAVCLRVCKWQWRGSSERRKR